MKINPFIIVLNLVICAALSFYRISGEKNIIFQAIAHLYVGGLFARLKWEYTTLAVILTVIETICSPLVLNI